MNEVQQKVYNCLESGGCTVREACRAAGILRKQFYEWLKSDDAFRERIMHSDVADIVTIDDVVFINALNGTAQDRRLYYERVELKRVDEGTTYADRQLEILRSIEGK